MESVTKGIASALASISTISVASVTTPQWRDGHMIGPGRITLHTWWKNISWDDYKNSWRDHSGFAHRQMLLRSGKREKRAHLLRAECRRLGLTRKQYDRLRTFGWL